MQKGHVSEAQMELFDEKKTRGRISRDRVPLSKEDFGMKDWGKNSASEKSQNRIRPDLEILF
jgi:hypothetical protein